MRVSEFRARERREGAWGGRRSGSTGVDGISRIMDVPAQRRGAAPGRAKGPGEGCLMTRLEARLLPSMGAWRRGIHPRWLQETRRRKKPAATTAATRGSQQRRSGRRGESELQGGGRGREEEDVSANSGWQVAYSLEPACLSEGRGGEGSAQVCVCVCVWNPSVDY